MNIDTIKLSELYSGKSESFRTRLEKLDKYYEDSNALILKAEFFPCNFIFLRKGKNLHGEEIFVVTLYNNAAFSNRYNAYYNGRYETFSDLSLAKTFYSSLVDKFAKKQEKKVSARSDLREKARKAIESGEIYLYGSKEKLEEGSYLFDSWGWDQTQVDFYRVKKISGFKVTLISVCNKFIRHSGQDDIVEPGRDGTQEHVSILTPDVDESGQVFFTLKSRIGHHISMTSKETRHSETNYNYHR